MLVPPGDTPALAAALATLAGDPALRRRFGEAGRRIAENEYSVQSVEVKTVALYRSLLGEIGA